MIYDIEVAAIGVETVSAAANAWTVLDLSTIPANSVTAAQPGADVAFVEIDNLTDATGIALKLYDVAANAAIDDNTLKIPGGGVYTLSKILGLRYVALRGNGGAATVEVRLHSHQTATTAPWPS